MSLADDLLGQSPPVFHLLNGDQVSVIDFGAYEEYVKRQQKMFSELGSPAIYPYDNKALGKVADHIRRHNQRDQTIAYIATLSPKTDIIARQATLDLVTRLIVMVEVGCLEKPSGFMHQTGPHPLPLWTGNSLANLTTKCFPVSSFQDCTRQLPGPIFDGWSLENVAGIKIEFTDNLADHLRLTNNNTQLYVFYHVAYLEHQRHRSVSFTIHTTSAATGSDMFKLDLPKLNSPRRLSRGNSQDLGYFVSPI
ncbi:hypothetical protein FOVG_17006 [Fusarium oxysporum f. sp. pisi HDV247]|uniref:Uncharacterized protein n=1 Tax=Fusarium oxysporum f. sp. pisi HDV247 TaxID=1080344 RepID=W9NG64_FUSOX|nr:hypothetical protein FOVG_17006 [Fusarium oxysporum f. sp. pisi HDV247]